jgi:hypothetical protein
VIYVVRRVPAPTQDHVRSVQHVSHVRPVVVGVGLVAGFQVIQEAAEKVRRQTSAVEKVYVVGKQSQAALGGCVPLTTDFPHVATGHVLHRRLASHLLLFDLSHISASLHPSIGMQKCGAGVILLISAHHATHRASCQPLMSNSCVRPSRCIKKNARVDNAWPCRSWQLAVGAVCCIAGGLVLAYCIGGSSLQTVVFASWWDYLHTLCKVSKGSLTWSIRFS